MEHPESARSGNEDPEPPPTCDLARPTPFDVRRASPTRNDAFRFPMPPAAPAVSAPSRRVVLDFDPARDGFHFVNRFTWTEGDLAYLSEALRPLVAVPAAGAGLMAGRLGGRRGALAGLVAGVGLGRAGVGDGLVRAIARRWSAFGLCGGMALTAIERWPKRGRVATFDLQPGPIRALLRRRQRMTLDASLGTFARYWLRVRFVPGNVPHAPLAADLVRELDRIEAALASGRPVLLGLVGDAPDPFALHQVVGFGIERSGPLDATLQVYDPNAPGLTRTITTVPSPEAGRTSITTDLSAGPRPGGGFHISTQAGRISHLFRIDAE